MQEIQPQATLADNEYTSEHPEVVPTHLEQELKETEFVEAKVEKKQSKSLNKYISDKPLVQKKVDTNKGDLIDKKHVQNNGKNKAFYARLDQENIKECPSCLHYYDDLHYDKHLEILHEHACRLESILY